VFLTEGANMMIRLFINLRASIPSMSDQPSVARAMLSAGVKPGNRNNNDMRMRQGGTRSIAVRSCPWITEQKVERRCTKCYHFVCMRANSFLYLQNSIRSTCDSAYICLSLHRSFPAPKSTSFAIATAVNSRTR